MKINKIWILVLVMLLGSSTLGTVSATGMLLGSSTLGTVSATGALLGDSDPEPRMRCEDTYHMVPPLEVGESTNITIPGCPRDGYKNKYRQEFSYFEDSIRIDPYFDYSDYNCTVKGCRLGRTTLIVTLIETYRTYGNSKATVAIRRDMYVFDIIPKKVE